MTSDQWVGHLGESCLGFLDDLAYYLSCRAHPAVDSLDALFTEETTEPV